MRIAAALDDSRLSMSVVSYNCAVMPMVATWSWIVLCGAAVVLATPERRLAHAYRSDHCNFCFCRFCVGNNDVAAGAL